MSKTPNTFIQNIKKNTSGIVSKFISQNEIEKSKKENSIKNRKSIIINSLNDKIIKILVEDTEKKSIKTIFIAFCRYDGHMLNFSPQQPNNDEYLCFKDIAINPDFLTEEFTLPGVGLNCLWHLTPLL